jgi:hypothetical protein
MHSASPEIAAAMMMLKQEKNKTRQSFRTARMALQTVDDANFFAASLARPTTGDG